MSAVMSHDIATPEMLERIAGVYSEFGEDSIVHALRAMATAWRATERALAEAQAENSALMLAMDRAHLNARRLEDLAAATANVLASVRPPLRTQAEPPAQVPA